MLFKVWEIIERANHWEVREYLMNNTGERHLMLVLACDTMDDVVKRITSE